MNDVLNEERRTKAMEKIAEQLKIKNQIDILNMIIHYSENHFFAKFTDKEIQHQIMSILKEL